MARIGRARKLHNIIKARDNSTQARNILTSPTDEVLNNTDHEILKDFVDGVEADEVRQCEASLLMDKVLYGKDALLSNLDNPTIREEVRKRRQIAAEKKEARLLFEKDKDKYVQDIINEANNRIGDVEKAKVGAAERAKTIMAQAVAEQKVTNQTIQYKIKNDPIEVVMVPPKFINRKVGKTVQPMQVPWEVRFAGLPPIYVPAGHQELPKIVATRMKQMIAGDKAQTEYKNIFASQLEMGAASQKLRAIKGMDVNWRG